jgi:hypothetical protein
VEFVSPTGGQAFAVAPITMDELVKAMDFVEVAERNDAHGSVTFRLLGAGAAEDFIKDFERALDEADAEAGAVAEVAEPQEAVESEPAQESEPVMSGPPVEFESSHREAIGRHGPGGVLRYEVVNFQEVEDAGLSSRVHEVMQALGQQPSDSKSVDRYGWIAPVENYATLCEYVATFAEIVDRDNAQQTLKLKIEPTKLPAADDEALLKAAGRWLPDAADPDYHKRLSELMWDAEKRKVNPEAVEALLAVTDVARMDKEVRKKVAQNFRAIAMEDTLAYGRAVDGLVHYGGKFSVPVLIELLDRPSGRIDREIFAALAKLKDRRGAVVLAERLANDSEREAALTALREMGPVAEGPLLEAAASDDTRVVGQVIAVLGQMGTKKSYPTLRKLTQEEDEEISTAAKNALAKIEYREKAAKGK